MARDPAALAEDPVTATRAFGSPRAPDRLLPAVMEAVRDAPVSRAAGAARRAALVAATAAVIAAWAVLRLATGLVHPLQLFAGALGQALAPYLAAVAAELGAAVAAAASRWPLAAAGAALVVAAEVAVLSRWPGLASR